MVLRTREITMPPTSKTQALVEFIREQIALGEWGPGHKLPSRLKLMREHHVSLSVVRDAEKLLVFSGELVSVPSVGVFVPGEPEEEEITQSGDNPQQ